MFTEENNFDHFVSFSGVYFVNLKTRALSFLLSYTVLITGTLFSYPFYNGILIVSRSYCCASCLRGKLHSTSLINLGKVADRCSDG
jgi:hypothetical protein